MPAPLPLAIGLIYTASSLLRADVARTRVRMGAFAFREGYALIETFAIGGGPVRDDAALAGLIGLADRCSARTVLAGDDIPMSYLATVRRAAEIAVVPVPSRLLIGR